MFTTVLLLIAALLHFLWKVPLVSTILNMNKAASLVTCWIFYLRRATVEKSHRYLITQLFVMNAVTIHSHRQASHLPIN
jgi:hypothetical protein